VGGKTREAIHFIKTCFDKLRFDDGLPRLNLSWPGLRIEAFLEGQPLAAFSRTAA
jgi:hypothetical protein